ncbi:Flp family type IVb pilin [Roseomonas populi]|uniref:Flp family type IVb pilin n=1 Tax=Roseomonas populi TaxID=3121582 RepID=A0ABT1X1A1_9PROT|nr:Flp family type IVb pilin [Roseomonas pecuniae]MCR0981860.1 Flp family type IVb pilin [Roseomonas pecuniae]
MSDVIGILRTAKALLQDRKGVTALEYGLIAAAISVVLITAVPSLASALSGVFGRITTALN